MRRDGDVLAEHLTKARREVLLCAPFMKEAVVRRLLSYVDQGVAVMIVTRWRPEEVAAGVTDLAVLDLVQQRPNTTMHLLNHLHAKIYRADALTLAGSANLTATALGWCNQPNLELLVEIANDSPALRDCLAALAGGRLATLGERDQIQAQANQFVCAKMPEAVDVNEDLAAVWLPRLAAPKKLFAVYSGAAREQLPSFVFEAAEHDLNSLAIVPELSEAAFKEAVQSKIQTMPAIAAIRAAARDDLADAEAHTIIARFAPEGDMPAQIQWQIVREWISYFLEQQYEFAAQNFIMRPKTTATRL